MLDIRDAIARLREAMRYYTSDGDAPPFVEVVLEELPDVLKALEAAMEENSSLRNRLGDNQCHLESPDTDHIPPKEEFLKNLPKQWPTDQRKFATLAKLILGVVIIAAMLTGSPRRWVHFSEEQDLAVIQVDQMPSGAAVELWSGAYAVRLSREQLAELALERAALPKRP